MWMHELLCNGIDGTLGCWAHMGDGDDGGDWMGAMGSDKTFEVEGVSGAAVCLLLMTGM